MLKRLGLTMAALLAVVAIAWATNMSFSTGAHFLTGPRLIDGSDLNVMVDRVNGLQAGTVTGTYTGTFQGAVGGVTPNTGAFTTLSSSGVYTPTGGVAAAGGSSISPRNIAACAEAATTTTPGTNTTPVATTTYIDEVTVPANMTITGVAVFNGTVASGNITVGLATAAGAPITAAKSASTAMSGTAAYQLIPFATPYAAVGPATYFIQYQIDNTTGRPVTIPVGNCATTTQTSGTYGTFVSFTAPTTFTTNVGVVASLY